MTRPTKQKAHSTITLVVRCTRMVMAIGKSVLFETCSNSHISLLQVNMQGKYISDKTRVFIWGEFKLFIAWVLCLKCLAEESKPSEIMESPLSDATWTFSDEGVHSVHRHQWSQGEVVEAPSMLGSLLQLDVVASSASAQGRCPVSTMNTINLDWGLGGVHIGAAGDMYYVLCTCYTGYDSTPVLAVFNRQNLQIVSYSQWPKPVVPHFTRTGWFSRHFYRILATPILTVLYGLGLIDLPPLYRTPPSPDSAQISRGKYMERTSLALSICDLAGHHNWLWI